MFKKLIKKFKEGYVVNQVEKIKVPKFNKGNIVRKNIIFSGNVQGVGFRMDRVIIIGCSGSGKSTLSRKISKKTNLPIVHLDKLFWKDGWVNISIEEFDNLLNKELKKERWIVDGNYSRTLKERLKRCDTVIYLDYPRRICLLGAIKRVLSNYGKVRLDMAEGCPERFDIEFIKWIWNFNKTHRNDLYKILKEEKDIYIFTKRKQCNEFFKML